MAENGTLEGLTRGQRRAIPALLECATIAEAAEQAEVGERTLYRYLADPQFKRALRQWQAKVIAESAAALIGSRPKAIETLLEALDDETASWSEKIRAANYLMGHSGTVIELDALIERLDGLEEVWAKMKGDGA